MHRSPLIEPEPAELDGLGHHRGIGSDLLLLGRTKIDGDLLNELRNVVQQQVGGEDVPLVDVDDLIELLEPAARPAPCARHPGGVAKCSTVAEK